MSAAAGGGELRTQTVPDLRGSAGFLCRSSGDGAWWDHESPVSPRVKQGLIVMVGWAAAPEGTSAVAVDGKME